MTELNTRLLSRIEGAALETLAITLYANDCTNCNTPHNPSWMELPADDRAIYRRMAERMASRPDPETVYGGETGK